MTDVLVRNIPENVLARVDEHAARLGLSRGEYLRRQIEQNAGGGAQQLTVAELRRASELSRDLLDEDVMHEAWS